VSNCYRSSSPLGVVGGFETGRREGPEPTFICCELGMIAIGVNDQYLASISSTCWTFEMATSRVRNEWIDSTMSISRGRKASS
jgi:hypothetical protein